MTKMSAIAIRIRDRPTQVIMVADGLVPTWHQNISNHLKGGLTHIRNDSTFLPLEPLLLSRFNLIPAWITNHMHIKMWDKITHPCPNFNGCTIEVWEWISNFVP